MERNVAAEGNAKFRGAALQNCQYLFWFVCLFFSLYTLSLLLYVASTGGPMLG